MEDGVWRTIGGRRVFIKEGQSLETAMKESGKFEKTEDKKEEFKETVVELDGNRKLLNAVKKAGIETYNPQGKWNGYGYEKLPKVAKIKTKEEMKIFNKLKKEIEPTKTLSSQEKYDNWSKRLSKLTGISIEEAQEIATEKLEYHQSRIDKLEERNYESRSKTRDKLIKEIERENPLRNIKDSEHATAILLASERHNQTGYDSYLEEARELAKIGDIDFEEVRDYARNKAMIEKYKK